MLDMTPFIKLVAGVVLHSAMGPYMRDANHVMDSSAVNRHNSGKLPLLYWVGRPERTRMYFAICLKPMIETLAGEQGQKDSCCTLILFLGNFKL